METVHPAVVANIFYPGDSKELRAMISKYLAEAKNNKYKNIRGLISPHAGYPYSGQTAARGYKQFADISDKQWKVMVMAPSHYVYFEGVSVGNYDFFETPLGKIKVEKAVTDKMLAEAHINFVPEAYEREHALEVQLPLLQTSLKNWTLIPMVFGKVDSRGMAEVLNKYIDDETLIIVSSDLSHFMKYEDAKKRDLSCLEAIVSGNIEQMNSEEACGKGPILTLMHLARMNGWKLEIVDYRNSGDTAGDKSQVVGYGSVVCLGS